MVVPTRATEPGSVRLSLVIPTYNEASNVVPLISALEALLEPELGAAYELIIVDDNSPDGTAGIVEALLETHPRVRLMKRTTERGLSTAVIRGWQAARGEVLGVMDADLQHPVEPNLRLLEEITRGASRLHVSAAFDGMEIAL